MTRVRTLTIVAFALLAACSDPADPPIDPPDDGADITLEASRDNTLFEESDTLSNGSGQSLTK